MNPSTYDENLWNAILHGVETHVVHNLHLVDVNRRESKNIDAATCWVGLKYESQLV